MYSVNSNSHPRSGLCRSELPGRARVVRAPHGQVGFEGRRGGGKRGATDTGVRDWQPQPRPGRSFLPPTAQPTTRPTACSYVADVDAAANGARNRREKLQYATVDEIDAVAGVLSEHAGVAQGAGESPHYAAFTGSPQHGDDSREIARQQNQRAGDYTWPKIPAMAGRAADGEYIYALPAAGCGCGPRRGLAAAVIATSAAPLLYGLGPHRGILRANRKPSVYTGFGDESSSA